MKIFTAHMKPGAAPILVHEGFSWTALIFGPFWLLLHRAWIAGILALAAGVLLDLLPRPWGGLLETAMAVAIGLFGRDLWRWSLDRRGYVLCDVVAAPDHDSALARLLDRRPDQRDAALIQALR